MDEDWDFLFILDSCRVDTFREQCTLPGRTETKLSQSSSTPEFCTAMLDRGTHYDTVYITANSQLAAQSNADADFHAEINVWQEEWNDNHGVPPDTVTKHFLRALETFQNKRLLVHYIQPHLPFLGEMGQRIHDLHNSDINNGTSSVWLDKLSGHLSGVSDADLWRAYRENLDLVLNSIADVFSELDGRTVVSADHGQLIGERVWPLPLREYGHPTGVYDERLVRVPWHIYESGERRKIISEEPIESDPSEPPDAVVRDRLEKLGYMM